MANSMTGFARVQGENEQLSVIWECRSVNHRYLDINFRMPEQLRNMEIALRQEIGQFIKRGKLDLILRYELKQTDAQELELNAARVQQLFHLQTRLTQHHSTLKELSTADILGFPGVIQEADPENDSMQTLVSNVFNQALQALNQARANEGERIIEFITQQAKQITQHVLALRELQPQMREQLRQRTLKKLADLELKPDNERLEQELVFYTQRMDVMEELDRLDSHLTELSNTLKQKKPIGRRLDFLMQEFNREANTLASKSQHASSTMHAVELKVLIEQMREQIQNLE